MALAQRLGSPRTAAKRTQSEKKEAANRIHSFEKLPTVQALIEKAREIKKETGVEEFEAHASST